MLVKKAVFSGALFTPWPLNIDGTMWKGSRFGFSHTCNTECYQGNGKYYCRHGLAYLQKQIGEESVTVCGYVDDWAKVKKEYRQLIGNRKAKDDQIYEWFEKIQKLRAAISSGQTKSSPLGALHEINRWASQINVIAQRMVLKDRNLDFSANFEAASRDMKSLYKASTMLVDAFDYLNIFYNPSSAAYGKKRSVDLYKLVDKIRIILIGAEGASQNKKIYINGELRRNVDLYESFKIIPFCLLQNAIKYSFDSDIVISFSTNYREVEMSVESSGPQIKDAEKTKIFESGFRGELSRRMHHEGLGMGLYIAKVVADAHNLEIRVQSAAKNYQREGIPVFTNTFSIKIPTDTPFERRTSPRELK